MFYLRLKSCNTPVQSHPVISRIVQIRQVSQPHWVHVTTIWLSCDFQLKRSVKCWQKVHWFQVHNRTTHVPTYIMWCHVTVVCQSWACHVTSHLAVDWSVGTSWQETWASIEGSAWSCQWQNHSLYISHKQECRKNFRETAKKKKTFSGM